jgi:hypothetical protein
VAQTNIRRFAIVIAAIILGACGQSENRYLKRQVRRDEVVGVWVRNRAAEKGYATIGWFPETIIIREDDTCSVRGFVADSAPKLIDRDCRWRINHDKRQRLFLHWNGKTAGFEDFYFDEENGRLLLWQFADDPDAWRYVEYQKESRRPA